MKAYFARGLVWTSLLGLCLAAVPGWAATKVLLNANFNNKPLDTAIGTGGPSVGEPVFINSLVEAKVQATPLATPSLHIKHLTSGNFEPVVFEFLGQAEPRDGDVRVAFTIRSPGTLTNFQVLVTELGNSLDRFGRLHFTPTGDIFSTDATGSSGIIRTYTPNETLEVEYLYHLDARTYDLRINNVLLLDNRPHGVTTPNQGIGRVTFATDQTVRWVIDEIAVTHITPSTLLLDANFNGKTLDAQIGTGGAIVGEPTGISPGLSAVVRASPFPTRSLHFSQTTTSAEKVARFEFLEGAQIRTGELVVSFVVLTPGAPDAFRIRMRQPSTGTDLFSGIGFDTNGQVRTLDAPNSANTTLLNYSPNQTLRFRLVYQVAAGTYDVYVDGIRRLQNGVHGVTDPELGIGAVDVGLIGISTQNWVFDDLRVEHNPMLLDADFNEQAINQQIGTGGAIAGQPISVNSSLSAEPRTVPFATPSLVVEQATTGTPKLAVFEFLGNAEISGGELRIGMRVKSPSSNSPFSIDIREQGSSTAEFGSLSFLGNGTIRTFDSGGSAVIGTYTGGVEQQFEFRFYFDTRKYDIYIDRLPAVVGRSFPSSGGIGRITVGTTATTTGKWAVDDIHAYVANDAIFISGFDS